MAVPQSNHSAAAPAPGPSRALLTHLREQIQKVQAAPRRYLAELQTGLEELDALHALQLGTVVELCGEAASGRTSVALRAVAAAGREARLSAWVDGPVELYPPGAAALGVDLRRLLVVRPKEPGRLVWATCQLARSGAFATVVADFTHTGVRLGLADAQKLAEAARKGGTLLLLLTAPDAPGEGLLRFSVRPAQQAKAAALALLPAREPARPAPVAPASGLPGTLAPDSLAPAAAGAWAAASGRDEQAEPPDIELTVARSRSGPMGRVLAVPRCALFSPRAPVLRRCAHLLRDAGPARFLESLPGGRERPKKNLIREGYGGLYASRPGRDGPFLPMRLPPVDERH